MRPGWIESPASPPLIGLVYTRVTDAKIVSKDGERAVELQVEQIVPEEWRQTVNDVVITSGVMSRDEAIDAVEKFFTEVFATPSSSGSAN